MTRKWFQIHLSTAIVLMVLAGGMVWLNVSWQQSVLFDSHGGHQYAYGWPVHCFVVKHQYFLVTAESQILGGALREYDALTFGLIMKWIVPNALATLGVLGIAAVILEWRIRREARKP
jgi:hypothetical protein